MRPSDFLPPDTPAFVVAIVTAAHDDLGSTEDGPPFKNRGRYPDLVNAEFGSPLGSYWCANAHGHWAKQGGGVIPDRDVGSCAAWHQMHVDNGTFSHTPVPGATVLYDHNGDGLCDHVACVEQIAGGMPLEIGGNTTLGGGLDRNGWIVQQKAVDTSKLLGYGHPTAAV